MSSLKVYILSSLGRPEDGSKSTSRGNTVQRAFSDCRGLFGIQVKCGDPMAGDYGNKVMVTYMRTICGYRTIFLNQKVSTNPKLKILKIKIVKIDQNVTGTNLESFLFTKAQLMRAPE